MQHNFTDLLLIYRVCNNAPSLMEVEGGTWDVCSTEAKLLVIGTDFAESLMRVRCLAPSIWDFKAAFPMLAYLNFQ